MIVQIFKKMETENIDVIGEWNKHLKLRGESKNLMNANEQRILIYHLFISLYGFVTDALAGCIQIRIIQLEKTKC